MSQYLEMLKAEFQGAPGTHLRDLMTTCLFSYEWDLKDYYAAVRHGILPAGTTYDPMTVPPWTDPNWVLDIDVYEQPERHGRVEPFVASSLADRYESLANREYAVFRTLVKEEFLRQNGGR